MKEIANTYSDEIRNIYKEFEKHIDDISYLCQHTPNGIDKTVDDNGIVNIEETNNRENTLCNVLVEVQEWTQWSAELIAKSVEVPIKAVECICAITGETAEFVNKLVNESIEYIIKWLTEQLEKLKNHIIVKRIIKKLKLITLKIKKALLNGQLKAYKCLQKVLIAAKDGKFVGAVQQTFAAIMASIKFVMTLIDAALNVITIIIKSLGIMLTLDGTTMAFFVTPKTLSMGNMKSDAVESVHTIDGICSWISDEANAAVDMATKNIKNINVSKKGAYIASQVASYEATNEIPDAKPISLLNITPEEIKNILLPFIASEALPKYEKLNLLNLRFLMWLTNSFNLAMKQSFGLPGYP